MADWQIALRRIEMPFPRYISFYVLPAAMAGLVTSLILIFSSGGFSEGALFSGVAGIFYSGYAPHSFGWFCSRLSSS